MDEHIQYQNRSAPPDETQEVLQPGETRLSWSLHDEEELRKRAFVRLGVVLLIAFLMPVVIAGGGGIRLIFINIKALGEEGVPPLLKFFSIYPALAGIATLILASRSKGFARSIVFIAMGFVTILVASGVTVGQAGWIRNFARLSASELGGVLGGLGVVGIYAGSRARWFRPGSRLAALVGAVGGTIYLVTLVLPTESKELGLIPLLTPFKLLFSERAILPELRELPKEMKTATGLLSLVQMALLIGAAILCVGNLRGRPEARKRAGRAFRLWIWSVVAIALTAVYALVLSAAEDGGRAFLPALWFLAKMGLWIGGLLLLIPMGATDLVVSLSRMERAEVPRDLVRTQAIRKPVAVVAVIGLVVVGALLTWENVSRQRQRDRVSPDLSEVRPPGTRPMREPLSLKVKVADEQGKPVVNAAVSVVQMRASGGYSFPFESTPKTGASGKTTWWSWREDRDVSKFIITAYHRNYGLATVELTPAEAHEGKETLLTLKKGPLGSVSGTITDEAGKPIPGAAVTAMPEIPGPTQDFETKGTTDEAGKYSISVVPDVAHSMTVSKDGFVQETRSLLISSGGAAQTMDFVLGEGHVIEGKVVFGKGIRPARNWLVNLYLRSGDFTRNESVDPDRTPYFKFRDVTAGTYDIEALMGVEMEGTRRTMRAFAKEVKTDTKDLVIKFAVGSIIGKVVSVPDGKPVREFRISPRFLGRGAEPVLEQTFASETGEFEMNSLAEGTYRLQFDAEGHPTRTLDDIKVEGDEATRDLVVELGVVKLSIPEENLKIPEEMQACAANFQKIQVALENYRKDKGEFPGWLSDLVPDYLGAGTLLCPNAAERKSPYWPDPNLPCSYTYEFSRTVLPAGWSAAGMPCRDWKAQQMKSFGGVVPIVRCHHHGADKALSLSVGGDVYWGVGFWESLPFLPGPGSPAPLSKPAPDFELQDLDGKEVRLSDHKGEVVLVHFWATWSLSCPDDVLALQELYEEYKDKGLAVVAISVDRSEDAVRELLKDVKLSYPIAMRTDRVMDDYGAAVDEPIKTIPTTIVISKGGFVYKKLTNVQSKAKFEEEILPLLRIGQLK